MNTTENNKLIAEFMQLQTAFNHKGIKEYYQREYNSGSWYQECELKYHTEWNWLMPVVDKIEKNHKANFKTICSWNEFNECSYYQVIVNIEKGTMSKDKTYIYDPKKVYEHSTQTCRCKKKATYEAIIEFIKWYNKQN